MIFYHGSCSELIDVKFLLPNKNGYVNSTGNKELEELFELHRPSTCISRYNSVFISDDINLIDPSGGYIDFIYEVECDVFDKSDLSWYTKASMDILNNDINSVLDSIHNYWIGKSFYDLKASCFEYRTKKANILKLLEIN